MAQSRLEKIGTIYTRTTGLLKSGAMKFEDRPLWYDIYEAFPPKDEPRFDRPAPNIPLRKIFYDEDKIRAIFHRNNKKIGATNLFDTKHKTLTQKFIETYKKMEEQYGSSTDEKQLYLETISTLKKSPDDGEDISLSSAFQEAQSKQKPSIKVNVSELFK